MVFKERKAVGDFPQRIFCWYEQCENVESKYRKTKFLIQIPLKTVSTVPMT